MGKLGMTRRTALIVTLGCRLNQADSGLICSRLERLGWRIVRSDAEDSLDLIVVNSCSVTASAFQKSRYALKRLRRRHPEAFIVLTGCSADIDNAAWEADGGVDAVLPNAQKPAIGALVSQVFANKAVGVAPAVAPARIFKEGGYGSFPYKSRANLKIQEGCNTQCSYCVVPRARGPERSRDVGEAIEDLKSLIGKGFKEIILTGVNICAYNCDGIDLRGLLERMLAVEGDFRLRLSSTEPHPVLDSVLDLMVSNPRLCRSLHLPLQHGSDPILKAMGRPYGASGYRSFAERVRHLTPEIHLGTDLIVGFPGETEALFEESYEFVKSLGFANMHIFPFSPRSGTPAASTPGRISQEFVAQRVERLRLLKGKMELDFKKSFLGQAVEVLIQRVNRRGICEALSGNYLKIEIERRGEAVREMQFGMAKILEVSGDGKISGSLVSK